MMASKHLAIYALAALMALSPASATPSNSAEGAQSPQAGLARNLPEDSTSQHTIGQGADRISYSATAGTLPLTNDKGEATAKVFYVSYSTGEAARPVSFVFNGGPGAAAAFLHLGALGPKVLNFTADGAAPVQPVALSDNPDSWLGFTDLVFVDPVGTGFSRAVGGGSEAEKPYYGVNQDADAMADFVRLYLARAGRELAPVYLVGESYGGFRALLLSHRLLDRGIGVKGAILVSPALEFSMIRGDQYALLPLALQLPSIAASHLEAASGHDAPLDQVTEAETFAASDYLLHLVRGLSLDDAIKAKLARLTGLDPELVARHHGRVSRWLFRREYVRREHRATSIYDGSISAPVPRPADDADFDPILDGAVAVLTPLMVRYAHEELGFKTDLPYKLLNRDVSKAWEYGIERQGYAGSLDDLQKARTLNPGLKVFIAHGYTDLATPYAVSRFLIGQLPPIESARAVEMRVYRGGHMMYMRPASRRALTADVRAVYGQPTSPQ
jgi:carboxypeptidase C (cathepsin A)